MIWFIVPVECPTMTCLLLPLLLPGKFRSKFEVETIAVTGFRWPALALHTLYLALFTRCRSLVLSTPFTAAAPIGGGGGTTLPRFIPIIHLIRQIRASFLRITS